MRNDILFGFGLSTITSLHNIYALYKFLNQSIFVDNAASSSIILAALIALSTLLGFVGSFFVNSENKLGAYFLVSAALVCIVQKVFGLEGTFSIWWIAGYSFSAATAFNKINMGIDIEEMKNYYYGQGLGSTIKSAIEIAKDISNGELTSKQAEWSKQVAFYIDKYGFIAYYGFIFAEAVSVTIPLMYVYLDHNNYPVDNVISNSFKLGGGIFVLILLLTEFQRRNIKFDDVLKSE